VTTEKQHLSFSSMRHADRSYAHWLYWTQNRTEPTPAMILGSYVDDLICGGDVEKYIVRPDTYTDEKGVVKPWTMASNSCKAWAKNAKETGKIVITSDMAADAEAMVESVKSHPEAAQIIGAAQVQAELAWVDGGTGVNLTGRADFIDLDSGVICDLKTCTDASPSEFARHAASFRYYVQLAMYADAIMYMHGKPTSHHLIIAVESTAPYGCAVYEIGPDDIVAWRKWYRSVCQKWAWQAAEYAQKVTKSVTYSDFIEPLQMPKWINY